MADYSMETAWDLRDPEQRQGFEAAARKFVSSKRKSQFKSTELAEAIECNMPQARRILNALIAEGAVTFEGSTRDTVYQKAG